MTQGSDPIQLSFDPGGSIDKRPIWTSSVEVLPLPLTQNVIAKLTTCLRFRSIDQGIAVLERAEADFQQIGPTTPNPGSLLLLVAQWVDAGFRDARFLSPLLARFSAAFRREMAMQDYLQLRMAEGFCALSSGNSDEAIRILDLTVQAREDLGDDEKLALAHFWKGRAHRKKGEYEKSLAQFVRARELAESNDDRMFKAIIQIQESWSLFQQGQSKEALRLLASADATLKSTSHYIALGNIESARGRIVRRSGDYSRALKYFESAERLYEKRDMRHPNLARSLVNAAYVRRLLARQIRKQIDRKAQSGRPYPSSRQRAAQGSLEPLRASYQRLCDEAIDNLTRARGIYEFHGNEDGCGNVMLNLGYLHLDRGEIDRASKEANDAFKIGLSRNDQILMARARILGAACENAHVEEQTGEHDDVAVHASRAREYSEEALALAHNLQSRRLLAGAQLARGITAANDFYQDWEHARACASEASAKIGPGESDLLVETLADLKSRIVQASGINDTLRAWSEGIVGEKTFQQITEEFAEIVIPKVWMREDKKIARVAQRLSISPKKVRRVLRNAGWH